MIVNDNMFFCDEGIQTPHTKDTDCILDKDNVCIVCKVYHGEPCPECKQRGYHKPDCSLSDGNLK